MTTHYDAVRAHADLRIRDEGEGRYLVYNPRTDQLHVLRSAERQLLGMCDGRPVDAVIDGATSLLAERGVAEPAAVAGEVLRFVEMLVRRELVEPCDA